MAESVRVVNILAIDDDVNDRVLLRHALARRGLDLLAVESGIEGIEAAQHHRPDAILLDLSMPGLDGPEVIRILREHPETASIPIVVVTGFNDATTENMVIDLGADALVVKRPDYDALVTEVLDALCLP